MLVSSTIRATSFIEIGTGFGWNHFERRVSGSRYSRIRLFQNRSGSWPAMRKCLAKRNQVDSIEPRSRNSVELPTKKRFGVRASKFSDSNGLNVNGLEFKVHTSSCSPTGLRSGLVSKNVPCVPAHMRRSRRSEGKRYLQIIAFHRWRWSLLACRNLVSFIR